MRFILYFALLTGCFSCSPSLVLKTVPENQTLSIQLEFEPGVPLPVQEEFNKQVDDLISRYNVGSGLKLNHTPPALLKKAEITRYGAFGKLNQFANGSTLLIRITATQLVFPSQNAAGIAITSLGIAAPIIMTAAGVPFFIFFWYLPRTTSTIVWELSKDINGSNKNPIQEELKSPGFLKSPRKQILKHGISFSNLLEKRLRRMERILSKEKK